VLVIASYKVIASHSDWMLDQIMTLLFIGHIRGTGDNVLYKLTLTLVSTLIVPFIIHAK